MIAAGRLNRRVTLLAPQTRLSVAHEAVVKHRPVWTVWAEVKQTAADEVQTDGRTIARVKFTVIVRRRPDIDESWQIQIGDRTLPISSVIDRGRGDELEIVAHEVR